MFETFIATEENYDAYLRPAIYDSLKAVLAYYKLDSAANIYYNGRNEIAKLVGSNSGDSPTADRYTDGIFRNKIFIVPEVDRSEFWNNRRESVESPVWRDKNKLPLMLTPAFESKKIQVQVVCAHNTYADADNMQKKINRLRENQVVDFNFSPITHMPVNNSIMEFIETVHGMLKRGEPDTPDFSDWFYGCALAPFHIVSNVAGNHKIMVVPLKSPNIGIQFTDPFVSKVAKGQTYGRFEVQFSYTFYLNDFIGWELEYPLNVYQEEIPAQFIPEPQPEHVSETLYRSAPEILNGRALDTAGTIHQVPYYLKQPRHDPWACPKTWWVQPIIQARLVVDDVPEQLLCNVFDIPGFQWEDSVKAYFLRRHAVACKHHETPFFIQVYENDQLVDEDFLSMDELGNVTLKRVVNMKWTYRIIINLDWAIRDYSEGFWNDLSKNPEGWQHLVKIFEWFDFGTIPEPKIQHIDLIKQGIDKGFGGWKKPFNIYEMGLGLIVYNDQNRRL